MLAASPRDPPHRSRPTPRPASPSRATDRERGLARVAGGQRGLVTRRQLLALGFTPRMVDHRLSQRRLRRVHPGVYLAGAAPLATWGREQAALLWVGGGALLAFRSAAVAWGLLDPRPGDPVEVARVGDVHRARPGVRLTRAVALAGEDRACRHDLPTTGVARTLEDVAARHPAELDAALDAALLRRAVTREALADRLRPRAGGPGAARLRAALALGPRPRRSEAERRLFALLRRAGMPAPLANVRVAGHEVDALWERERVVVEVDGFAFHADRVAFERDRRRDADLAAAGYVVIRLTWRSLTQDPESTVARLAAALAGRGYG